ncbi:MAG: amidase [Myxococcales bacterium]
METLLTASAFEIAARVRAGSISSVDVVDLHIARIRQVNPLVNALVADRFDAAREEARAADARLSGARDRSSLPPLLGVPCTIKEFLAVDGMPQTGGWLPRRDHRATGDSTIVRRLREAGAIVLGVTNVPELGMWMETNNKIYGRTSNPYDLGRTAGGSSGGEAAIIAAGGSPFGIGSDIGGSIRIPAAFCGIAGHKPTGRLVPNTGHWPRPPAGTGYMVSGPMARRVSDLMPLLRLIAGPDDADDVVKPWALGDPGAVRLSDVAVFPVLSNGWARIHVRMIDAMEAAAEALEAQGARVDRSRFPRFRDVFQVWSAMLSAAAEETFAEMAGGGTPVALGRELLRFPFGKSNHTGPVLVLAAIETMAQRFTGRYEELGRRGLAMQAELEDILGDDGVLLHPPYTRPAPHHHSALLRTPFDFVCTALFNVLELPATVVPVGFDDRGLPVSVQVVARRGNDHLAIACAQAIERSTGGWICANPVPRRPPLARFLHV